MPSSRHRVDESPRTSIFHNRFSISVSKTASHSATAFNHNQLLPNRQPPARLDFFGWVRLDLSGRYPLERPLDISAESNKINVCSLDFNHAITASSAAELARQISLQQALTWAPRATCAVNHPNDSQVELQPLLPTFVPPNSAMKRLSLTRTEWAI